MGRMEEIQTFREEALEVASRCKGDIDTDKLHGFVHRDRRFDLIEDLIFSTNPSVRASAQFVMEEVSYLEDAKTHLRKVGLELAQGDNSQKQTFAIYCRDSRIFDPEIGEKIAELFGGSYFNVRVIACQYAIIIGLRKLEKLGRIIYENVNYSIEKHIENDDWVPSRMRNKRAFRLVLLFRTGVSFEMVERHSPLEDSFTLDCLEHFVTKHKGFSADIEPKKIGLSN